MSARGGHNDPRYKNGIRKAAPQTAIQALMAQANDPVQAGWHYNPQTSRYELTYCGLTAWLRHPRAGSDEYARYHVSGWQWLVGLIGDDEPQMAYDGLVIQFTAEVKRNMFRAALTMPIEKDDYGLEKRAL